MRVQFYFIIAVILFLLAACGSSKRLSNENLSGYFTTQDFALNPQYVIWHTDSDSSVVYFNFECKNLLFKKSSDKIYASFSVKYQLYSSYNSSLMLDSQTFFTTIDSISNESFYEGKIKFKANSTCKGVLRLQLTDEYRNTSEVKFIDVDKTSLTTRQNFVITDSTGALLFENFIGPNQRFNIIRSKLVNSDQFTVNCYFRSFPLAAPAFRMDAPQTLSSQSDSTFSISMDSVSSLSLKRYGFYHFLPQSNSRNGFTIFLYPEDFPSVTNASQLIESTRYLTTSKEHLKLVQSKNKKIELDRFWLDISGSQEQARKLIRTYYQRVQFANQHFSSYMEGWRTDRGMIYIIFGPPQSIYRNDDDEQWNYGTINSIPDLNFTFRKVGNPFTNNDYGLVRQPSYENAWYLAVDQWRQGRAINNN